MDQTTINALAVCVQTGRPALLLGDPGVGKTRTVEALAAALGLPCVIFTPASREGAMIGGYPVPRADRKGVDLLPVYQLIEPLLERGGVLFLDEFTAVESDMRKALRLPILEQRFGDVQLVNVSVVAAANPVHLGDAEDIGPALANRMVHLAWGVDRRALQSALLTGEWSAVKRVPRLPAEWRSFVPAARAKIASFLQRQPEHAHDLPPDVVKQSQPWPSPRMWFDYVAPLQGACDALGVGESELSVKLLAGCVGEGVAANYLTYLGAMDLPAPEEVMAKGKITYDSKRPDRTVTTVLSVAAWIAQHNTREYWCAGVNIYVDLAAKCSDIAALGMRALLEIRDKDRYPTAMETNSLCRKYFEPLYGRVEGSKT